LDEFHHIQGWKPSDKSARKIDKIPLVNYEINYIIPPNLPPETLEKYG
jgi:hypothetical protein